jgi:hypothetical protein
MGAPLQMAEALEVIVVDKRDLALRQLDLLHKKWRPPLSRAGLSLDPSEGT